MGAVAILLIIISLGFGGALYTLGSDIVFASCTTVYGCAKEVFTVASAFGFGTLIGLALDLWWYRKPVKFLRACLYRESALPTLFSLLAILQMKGWMQAAKNDVGAVDAEHLVRMRVEFDIVRNRSLSDLRDPRKKHWFRFLFRSLLRFLLSLLLNRKKDQSPREKHKTEFLQALQNRKKEDLSVSSLSVKNCTHLVQSRDRIKHYFEALQHFQVDPRQPRSPNEHFLFKVRVEEGYVAAQFLVCGLLDSFDEDWGKILDKYRLLLRDQTEWKELRKRLRLNNRKEWQSLVQLQLFQFNCWLLWGPSIPMCTCKAWTGAATERQLLQFGYGDENNSILLETEPKVLYSDDALAVKRMARRVKSLAGNLHWSQDMKLCDAQQTITVSESGGGMPLPVMRLDKGSSVEFDLEDDSYFSAYIWVMLVMCTPDKEIIFEKPWRNLIPFFEHGNIANEATREAHTQILAAKAIAGAEKLLMQHKTVVLRYACASDHSFCGKGASSGVIQGLLIARKKELRELLKSTQELLESAKDAKDRDKAAPVIDRLEALDRLEISNDFDETLAESFASCSLPDWVNRYKEDIHAAKKEKKKDMEAEETDKDVDAADEHVAGASQLS
jgi:hypothetical protein